MTCAPKWRSPPPEHLRAKGVGWGAAHWLRWTQLFSGADTGGSGIILGLVAQAGAIVVAVTAAYMMLSRREPVA